MKLCSAKKGIACLRFSRQAGSKKKSTKKCAEISNAKTFSIDVFQIGRRFYELPSNSKL